MSAAGGPEGLRRGEQRAAVEAVLGAARAGDPGLSLGAAELDASLQVAPFGPRGQQLRARARLAGMQASAWDLERVRVTFEAPALDAVQLARLRAAGLVAAEPGRPGRLLFEGEHAALAALVADEPALTPLYAAHRLACAAPLPPRVMGVVNVTPDSFSDGGRFLDPEAAIAHGLRLAEAGAELLDVGAESTRPGAEPVAADDERERVVPVVAGLAGACDATLSVDTTKADVAAAALEAGATVVNDVSAGRLDEGLFGLVGEAGAGLVLMHMQGVPRTMQVAPTYDDVVHEVVEHLRDRVALAWRAGVAVPKILVDPGIGFGKRLEDNLALIRALPELRSLGRPILVGVSRKSFLGQLGGIAEPARRLTDTAAAVTAGVLLGAEVLRVHDVEALLPTVRVAAALARV